MDRCFKRLSSSNLRPVATGALKFGFTVQLASHVTLANVKLLVIELLTTSFSEVSKQLICHGTFTILSIQIGLNHLTTGDRWVAIASVSFVCLSLLVERLYPLSGLIHYKF